MANTMLVRGAWGPRLAPGDTELQVVHYNCPKGGDGDVFRRVGKVKEPVSDGDNTVVYKCVGCGATVGIERIPNGDGTASVMVYI